MKYTKITTLLALAISSSAIAATDGPLTPNITSGSFEVNTIIEPTIAIKSVDDIDFGTYSPGINITASDNLLERDTICVYTNAPSFDLTISTTHGLSGDFKMKSTTNSDTLPYTVKVMEIDWDNENGYHDNAIIPVSSDIKSGPFSYHDSYGDDSCRDSQSGLVVDNIELSFELKGSDIVNAEPNIYTDVVTITARTEEVHLPLEG